MNKGLKWALIIGGVGVTGVAGYLIYKKLFKKEDNLGLGDIDNNNNNTNVVDKVVDKVIDKVTPTTYPKTPFRNKTEGDAFRKWLNDTYPKYAKEIDLDPSGEYDNSYIRKAYKQYGKEYSWLLVPQIGGAKISKGADSYFANSGSTQFRFYNNGRFTYGTGSSTKYGSYALGGKVMRSDSGTEATSGSVWTNINTIKGGN
jgi:hypothetical protein